MSLERNYRYWVLASVLMLLVPCERAQSQSTNEAAESRIDVLISGGELIDGSGASPRMADLGIKGDRIVFIGNSSKTLPPAARVPVNFTGRMDGESAAGEQLVRIDVVWNKNSVLGHPHSAPFGRGSAVNAISVRDDSCANRREARRPHPRLCVSPPFSCRRF